MSDDALWEAAIEAALAAKKSPHTLLVFDTPLYESLHSKARLNGVNNIPRTAPVLVLPKTALPEPKKPWFGRLLEWLS